MNDVVLVALIGAFGTVAAGLPAVLIERARRENNGDHAIVRRKLRELGLQIEKGIYQNRLRRWQTRRTLKQPQRRGSSQ
jgi:hypothetical protein